MKMGREKGENARRKGGNTRQKGRKGKQKEKMGKKRGILMKNREEFRQLGHNRIRKMKCCERGRI